MYCVHVLSCNGYFSSTITHLLAKIRVKLLHFVGCKFHQQKWELLPTTMNCHAISTSKQTHTVDASNPHQQCIKFTKVDMGVSKNNGTPKSSILIGFSIINHPFWGAPIFGNSHIDYIAINSWSKVIIIHSLPGSKLSK